MKAQDLTSKALIQQYLMGIESIRQGPSALGQYFAEEVIWLGCAPFDTCKGISALWRVYWQPLLEGFSGLRRRIDILLGGECEGERWVASTGYMIGQFESDWLGIPATGRETFIRFGEFYQLEGGQIVKAYVINDLLEVMQQAHCDPLPPSLGLAGFVPPPRTGDGVLLDAQPEAESRVTFDLAYDMLFKGLNEFDQADKDSMKQKQFWHDNMHWYGPAGIGATRDLAEFEDNHQLPWLRAFPDRQVVWESPMFADGCYAATAGWREVIATHLGEYLGHPPTGKHIEFRVMDFWRREGDLLLENWVFIDLIDTFRQFGVDLFQIMASRKKE